MSKQKTLGKLGEDCAAKFLEATVYKIVARNFRIRSAEIDIIAQLDNVIVQVREINHIENAFEVISNF